MVKSLFSSRRVSPSPQEIRERHNRNFDTLQANSFKSWFKRRHRATCADHYHQTAAQVTSDKHIDQMFDKLDQDGGGTLSVDEITSLFCENGITMSEAQVADMFAEAMRSHNTQLHRQQVAMGGRSKIHPQQLDRQSTEYNLKQEMSPEQFKIVASSPDALACKYSEV